MKHSLLKAFETYSPRRRETLHDFRLARRRSRSSKPLSIRRIPSPGGTGKKVDQSPQADPPRALKRRPPPWQARRHIHAEEANAQKSERRSQKPYHGPV